MNIFYRLYFNTDTDKNTSVRIPNGNENAANATVISTARTLAEDGMVKTRQGTLISPIKAQRVWETITHLNVS